MAQMCDMYNVLPQAGGVLDQAPWNIEVLKAFKEAIAEKRALDNNRK